MARASTTKLGQIQITENIILERDATLSSNGESAIKEDSVKVGVGGAGNAPWSKRTFCNSSHDSKCSVSTVAGAITKKVIAMAPMSQVCRLCRQGIKHEEEDCMKNYTGSSRGMEGIGVLTNVLSIYNSGLNCYVAKLTIHYDNSSKAVCR